ncbi:GntR family transcriptional regulator [Tepidamorphus sp. 3E244]|uniref:GntR family transcriptional regulator n=1 Tax=Tepidamorphus sp. 3E244 TaxID=3385498 RepID=UPI0038FCC7D5
MQQITPLPSLGDRVYTALLDQICSGALPAGTHLVQEQLAARLGVSRQPVQQAMALLKAHGIVQEQPGRGLAVAPLDLDEMRHRYDIRASLDELAARLAARRVAASPALATQIRKQGEAILDSGRKAVADDDLGAMIDHDVAFHEFLYEISGNPLLGTTADLHWHYLRRVMGEVLRYAAPGPAIWQQHEGILDAILKGDNKVAGDRARAHVDNAASRLSGAFASRQARAS